MRYVEKQVILQSLDHLWRDHLVTLDHLRQVIGWRGMAQRDPLNEYKSEAFELFQQLIAQWHEAVIAQMSRVEVRFQEPEPPPPPCSSSISIRRPARTNFRSGRSTSRSASVWRPRRRTRCRRTRPEEPGHLGTGRTQRAMSVRVGQEVQALPRPGRLIRARGVGAVDHSRRGARLAGRDLSDRGLHEPRREARLALRAAAGLSPRP